MTTLTRRAVDLLLYMAVVVGMLAFFGTLAAVVVIGGAAIGEI